MIAAFIGSPGLD
ncbi:hypothetical protein LINPERHAP1_LOCUS21195 [Linum perenne]